MSGREASPSSLEQSQGGMYARVTQLLRYRKLPRGDCYVSDAISKEWSAGEVHAFWFYKSNRSDVVAFIGTTIKDGEVDEQVDALLNPDGSVISPQPDIAVEEGLLCYMESVIADLQSKARHDAASRIAQLHQNS